MLSKNTSSSRAIPFKKMVEVILNDPFIPIAWQKNHKGMQGTEYFTDKSDIDACRKQWLNARNDAVLHADSMDNNGTTKQLCNRLLEPFMWTTMLITGSKEGWENFFNLRCPDYEGFKSKKEAAKHLLEKGDIDTSNWSQLDWLHLNKGQAEIHMMDLAEKIYDAYNENEPDEIYPEGWHIPFFDEINNSPEMVDNDDYTIQDIIKVSVAMAAHVSYTTVGVGKERTIKDWIDLHDRLMSMNPPHSSPMEHCAQAMKDDDYYLYSKGKDGFDSEHGWCGPYHGFMSYRYMVENGKL